MTVEEAVFLLCNGGVCKPEVARAALTAVVAEERELCAQVADAVAARKSWWKVIRDAAVEIAAGIRARGTG